MTMTCDQCGREIAGDGMWLVADDRDLCEPCYRAETAALASGAPGPAGTAEGRAAAPGGNEGARAMTEGAFLAWVAKRTAELTRRAPDRQRWRDAQHAVMKGEDGEGLDARWRIPFADHAYVIHARCPTATRPRGYLGAYYRGAHGRGSDLLDGDLSDATWMAILAEILGVERWRTDTEAKP